MESGQIAPGSTPIRKNKPVSEQMPPGPPMQPPGPPMQPSGPPMKHPGQMQQEMMQQQMMQNSQTSGVNTVELTGVKLGFEKLKEVDYKSILIVFCVLLLALFSLDPIKKFVPSAIDPNSGMPNKLTSMIIAIIGSVIFFLIVFLKNFIKV